MRVRVLLEPRHGASYAELVAFDQVLGPDRFLGVDVVLHDGTQHIELAFVDHAPPP